MRVLLLVLSFLPTLNLAVSTPVSLKHLISRQLSPSVGTPTANGIFLDQNPNYFYLDLPIPPPNMDNGGTAGPWAIPRDWFTTCAPTISSICAQFAPHSNPSAATNKWVSRTDSVNCLVMYWLPDIYNGTLPTTEDCTAMLQRMVDTIAQASGGTEINRASVNIQAGGFPHGYVGMSGSSTGVPVDKGLVSYILQGQSNNNVREPQARRFGQRASCRYQSAGVVWCSGFSGEGKKEEGLVGNRSDWRLGCRGFGTALKHKANATSKKSPTCCCTLPNTLVVDEAFTMDSGVYHMYMSELLFDSGSRLRVYDNLQEGDGTWKSEGEIMMDIDNFEVAKPVAPGTKPNLQIL
ncbi:MAG: hypothetical protein Q9167_002815 [Letrouitia subvulpina]